MFPSELDVFVEFRGDLDEDFPKLAMQMQRFV